MPKYILIGLGIPVILFLTMHYWTQFTDKTKKPVETTTFYVSKSTSPNPLRLGLTEETITSPL